MKQKKEGGSPGAEGRAEGGKAPPSEVSKAFREKMKRKLEFITTEIEVLGRERKDRREGRMVDVENGGEVVREIERYYKRKRVRREEKEPALENAVTEDLLESFNKLVFEINNLPLDYILAQSSKAVLTEEWMASLLERKVLAKTREIKKEKEEGALLQIAEDAKIAETRQLIEAETQKRKRVLGHLARESTATVLQAHKKLFPTGPLNGAIIPIRSSKQRKQESPPQLFHTATPSLRDLDSRHFPHSAGTAKETVYKALLHLFSLMKSNKSSVRFYPPASKKGNLAIHSSHITSLEKIKNEIGRLTTVSELARYRESKKEIKEGIQRLPVHLGLYKARKHGVAIPYTCEREDREDKPKIVPLTDKEAKNNPQINITYSKKPEEKDSP